MQPLVQLTSLQNPLVKAARQLATRKGRLSQGLFLCEGEHMVGEALSCCPQGVRCLFVEAGKEDCYAPLLAMAAQVKAEAQGGVALYQVPSHVLAVISQVKAPQGIAALVALPPPGALASMGSRLLLLENVQDPGNVGTMVRTLDAAGFDGCLLTPGCADPYGPKALRASMGSIFRVPLYGMGLGSEMGEEAPVDVPLQETEDLAQALKGLGYSLVAAMLDGAPFYGRQPLPAKVCLVIGNEGAGVTPALAEACTHRLALPMRGGAESLNAAVAAAIMMYDMVNRG